MGRVRKPVVVEVAEDWPIRVRYLVRTPKELEVVASELRRVKRRAKLPEETLTLGDVPRIWRMRAKSAVVVVSPDEVPSKNTIAVSSAPALLNVGSGSTNFLFRKTSNHIPYTS